MDPQTGLEAFERAADTALRTLPPHSARKVADELEAPIVGDREPNTAEPKARQGLFYRAV